MEIQKDAPPVRENSDAGRLLRAYVDVYPRKVGGETDGKRYGFKYHTQSQRSGDLTKRGFPVLGTKRKGEDYKEYRFTDPLVFDRARLLVRAWDAVLTVETMDRREGRLVLGMATEVNDSQETLTLCFSPDGPAHPHGRS